MNDPTQLQFLIGKDMLGKETQSNGQLSGEPNCSGVQVDWGNSQYACSHASLTASKWHQILVRKDATHYTTFFDGRLSSNEAGSFPYNTNNTAPLTIGQCEGGGYLDGKIDDIRIYNRALSDDEVAQLYAYESKPIVGGLKKAVKPSFSNLTPTVNYQLQVSG